MEGALHLRSGCIRFVSMVGYTGRKFTLVDWCSFHHWRLYFSIRRVHRYEHRYKSKCTHSTGGTYQFETSPESCLYRGTVMGLGVAGLAVMGLKHPVYHFYNMFVGDSGDVNGSPMEKALKYWQVFLWELNPLPYFARVGGGI